MKIEYLSDFDIAAAVTQSVVVAAAQNDNTLVAAPGATQRLAIATLKGQRTSGSTEATAVTVKNGTVALDYGDFTDLDPNLVFWDASSRFQLRILDANKALIASHSAANSITYVIRYFLIDA